jgi:Na+/H+ antiporter NhaA
LCLYDFGAPNGQPPVFFGISIIPHDRRGQNRKHGLVVGITAAIGFTVALFFATAAFPEGDALREAKLGALLSLSGCILALGVARIMRVGRFRIEHVS